MKQKKQETSARFRKELTSLEAVLQESVSGAAAETWRSSVQAAHARFVQAFDQDLASHRLIYQSILELTPELAARVESLRAGDTQLRDELTEHQQIVAGSRPAELQAARTELLAWISRCRAHESQVLNWFLESIYRDVGTGD